ncbi:hypothetical protein FDP41_008918 [Naegleria fowleri]|uniref:Uncharacterized protein n=1 Tax=Naegleria fowleri TaxID=5763 RepID=A0A6A5BI21_NAEFO|nr:uncharacterized protein FDP41_008918 [Naegleria fowleri]KAF0972669.1 hypothetical protein FDP41_008918 [Naegleria fowleri]CAG4718386.1 unnamed protein product [Naegleria fowleri]
MMDPEAKKLMNHDDGPYIQEVMNNYFKKNENEMVYREEKEMQIPRIELSFDLYEYILEFVPPEHLFGSVIFTCKEFARIILHDETFHIQLVRNNMSSKRKLKRVIDEIGPNGYNGKILMSLNCNNDEQTNQEEEFVEIDIIQELKKMSFLMRWGIKKYLIGCIRNDYERPLVLVSTYMYSDVVREQEANHQFFNSLVHDLIWTPSDNGVMAKELLALYEKVRKISNPSLPNLFKTKIRGFHLIHSLAFHNRVNILKFMCEHVPSPQEEENPQTTDKISHLLVREPSYHQNIAHIATSRNSMECLQYIVNDLKVDVNIQDRDGYTCLHIASSKNLVNVCKYLVQVGADKNMVDHSQMKPFQKSSRREIQELLRPSLSMLNTSLR